MEKGFQVSGTNEQALFTLKIHRGDGMALIAMNWKDNAPPDDFVGFAIEFKIPNGNQFFALKNRIRFLNEDGVVESEKLSTLNAPIQKFRWVHFPRNAELDGEFIYRVTPVFMNSDDELSHGESQEAAIELRRETYPNKLNVTFTRGFVSSQAFVDHYTESGSFAKLIPQNADDGLDFKPTHPEAEDAYAWMGFEARSAILEVLDLAIQDPEAEVCVVAYDLNEPLLVSKLEQLGERLKIIIDDDGKHGEEGSGETRAAERLKASAGEENVKRQHMGQLQHNKTIVVNNEATGLHLTACGSTNFSWRGFFVQANNAIILKEKKAVQSFRSAFQHYWDADGNGSFGNSNAAEWTDLQLNGIDAKVTFSPHAADNAVLKQIADDIKDNTSSSLFYSLAFLHQTPGVIRDAIEEVTNDPNIFVYGISDKEIAGGIELQRPDGNVAHVSPQALIKESTPEPFKSEPAGGSGNRMHHKFLVLDFDKPTARIYMGSYNFSVTADGKNGENLLLIKDRRIAVSYMIEAVRLFDHYHFRIAQLDAEKVHQQLHLRKPPRSAEEKAWWAEYYDEHSVKIKDRELFA
jgi:phosphatidylserine/phosphatidylglycerophosphate/cardiolipin synthase-like enzyme